MKCVMCSENKLGITFYDTNSLLCFSCIAEIKNGKLDVYAPNPFQVSITN
jgi:hypothetical protein